MQIRCGDLYADKAIEAFNSCAVSDKKCVPQKVDRDVYPVPKDSILDNKFDLNNFQVAPPLKPCTTSESFQRSRKAVPAWLDGNKVLRATEAVAANGASLSVQRQCCFSVGMPSNVIHLYRLPTLLDNAKNSIFDILLLMCCGCFRGDGTSQRA